MADKMQEIAEASRDLERSKIDVQLKLFSEQMQYQREKDRRLYENTAIANENARLAILKQGEMVSCLSQLSTVLGQSLTMSNAQGMPPFLDADLRRHPISSGNFYASGNNSTHIFSTAPGPLQQPTAPFTETGRNAESSPSSCPVERGPSTTMSADHEELPSFAVVNKPIDNTPHEKKGQSTPSTKHPSSVVIDPPIQNMPIEDQQQQTPSATSLSDPNSFTTDQAHQ